MISTKLRIKRNDSSRIVFVTRSKCVDDVPFDFVHYWWAQNDDESFLDFYRKCDLEKSQTFFRVGMRCVVLLPKRCLMVWKYKVFRFSSTAASSRCLKMRKVRFDLGSAGSRDKSDLLRRSLIYGVRGEMLSSLIESFGWKFRNANANDNITVSRHPFTRLAQRFGGEKYRIKDNLLTSFDSHCRALSSSRRLVTMETNPTFMFFNTICDSLSLARLLLHKM